MMKFLSDWIQAVKKSGYRHLSVQSIIIVLVCVIAYKWLDRPLAIFMLNRHPGSQLGHYDFTDKLTALAYFATILIMVFYAYMRIMRHDKHTSTMLAGALSLTIPVAFFIKTQLQYICGRIPPRYGSSVNNLLFLRNDKLYGFHFFHGGSFPSGHMCVFTAALLMISFYYPKFKAWYILALSILAFLLLYYNYHFLSDIISGTFLGYIIACVIHRLQSESASNN